jgi:hypothetical protein
MQRTGEARMGGRYRLGEGARGWRPWCVRDGAWRDGRRLAMGSWDVPTDGS